MVRKMTKKQRKVIEEHGWNVSDTDWGDGTKGYELQQHSPAGEDFSFCIEADDIPGNVMRQYLDFDPDEHIEMWIEARRNGVGGVPTARELVTDAEAIDGMLHDLACALADLK